jgi:uncharacterized protein (TIGR04255 family)
VSSHTPWKKPPLLEAVFEIRFPSVNDYAIFVGGMATVNHDRFPTNEKLPAADFPPFVQVEGVTKHRFFDINKTFIFQTGNDVISVNAVNYSGFSNFLDEIKFVIIAASSFIDFSKSTRFSLRYINKFSDFDDIFSVLSIKKPFDDFDKQTTKDIFLRHVQQEGENLFSAINIQFPVPIENSQDNLILDIEAFYSEPSINLDQESIFRWCEDAHEAIWKKFESLVSNNEKILRQ